MKTPFPIYKHEAGGDAMDIPLALADEYWVAIGAVWEPIPENKKLVVRGNDLVMVDNPPDPFRRPSPVVANSLPGLPPKDTTTFVGIELIREFSEWYYRNLQ